LEAFLLPFQGLQCSQAYQAFLPFQDAAEWVEDLELQPVLSTSQPESK